jgi:hypothetical protein
MIVSRVAGIVACAALFCFGNLAVAQMALAQESSASKASTFVATSSELAGTWSCTATLAGQPGIGKFTAKYEWLSDLRALKETLVSGNNVIGEFYTTYDNASQTVKGVAVTGGRTIVWENAGFKDGRSSEIGYVFDAGKMTEISRSTFEKTSKDHYVIRDFKATTSAGPGAATDTEECTRQ